LARRAAPETYWELVRALVPVRKLELEWQGLGMAAGRRFPEVLNSAAYTRLTPEERAVLRKE